MLAGDQGLKCFECVHLNQVTEMAFKRRFIPKEGQEGPLGGVGKASSCPVARPLPVHIASVPSDLEIPSLYPL